MQIDTTVQQVKELLYSENVKRVLVTTGTNVDPDAVGSALAIAEVLESRLEKTVTVAIEGFDQERYSFMKGAERIQSEVGQKSLIVSIEMGQNPIERINYNAEGTIFNLVLTPKVGQVDVDQINYSYTGLNYDVVIVVDTAARHLLGQWAKSFEQELIDIPVINIDHHADNEMFGTLNIVQGESASAATVLSELLPNLGFGYGSSVATNLLYGLMSDTGGFVNSNGSAEALRTAAQLVEKGANLREVMQNLFRRTTLPTLKLMGRVLSQIEEVEPGVVVGQVTRADREAVGLTDEEGDGLGALINNLLPGIQGVKVAAVLKERDNGEVRGSLRAGQPDVNVQAIAQKLGGGGHIAASGFKLTNTTVEEARQRVQVAIQEVLHVPAEPAAVTPEEEDAQQEVVS
jgi:phosphoesterase RecJ-like protein